MAKLKYRELISVSLSTGLSPDQAVIATAIALAESGGDSDAINRGDAAPPTWGPSIGLWQIRSMPAQSGTGESRDAEQLRDVAFNAKSMYAISNGGTNWTPWSVYKSGAYRKFLGTYEPSAVSETVDTVLAPVATSVDLIQRISSMPLPSKRQVGVFAGGAVLIVAGVALIVGRLSPQAALLDMATKGGS